MPLSPLLNRGEHRELCLPKFRDGCGVRWCTDSHMYVLGFTAADQWQSCVWIAPVALTGNTNYLRSVWTAYADALALEGFDILAEWDENVPLETSLTQVPDYPSYDPLGNNRRLTARTSVVHHRGW